ncbi:hypothetical protein [Bacillus chungangensis]|uniref:Phage protein n=1 Tax=Bacillus chungangensis TaxID=587633 RepID=A0ABT9WQN8_9BACI|nr:hypothetical protein [Bacillus chungangensis]MDQ0175599.1 hypothetical protein [Bacillus chungangensis]
MMHSKREPIVAYVNNEDGQTAEIKYYRNDDGEYCIVANVLGEHLHHGQQKNIGIGKSHFIKKALSEAMCGLGWKLNQ